MASKGIKGLPNWVWVYPGEPDPLTGVPAKTRYGLNLLSGEHKSLRKTQEMVRGGRYEKLVPEQQRKKYNKRIKNSQGKPGDYIRVGPFFSMQEALQYTSNNKDFKPDTPTLIQAHGNVAKKKYKGKHYLTITTKMPYSQLQSEMSRLAAGTPGINLFQMRTDSLIKDFSKIDKFYVYRKA